MAFARADSVIVSVFDTGDGVELVTQQCGANDTSQVPKTDVLGTGITAQQERMVAFTLPSLHNDSLLFVRGKKKSNELKEVSFPDNSVDGVSVTRTKIRSWELGQWREPLLMGRAELDRLLLGRSSLSWHLRGGW